MKRMTCVQCRRHKAALLTAVMCAEVSDPLGGRPHSAKRIEVHQHLAMGCRIQSGGVLLDQSVCACRRSQVADRQAVLKWAHRLRRVSCNDEGMIGSHFTLQGGEEAF